MVASEHNEIVKNKPKIAWVNEHAMLFNGSIRYIYEVSRRLNKDYDVSLIVQNISDDNWLMYKEIGVEIVNMKVTSTDKMRYWLLYPYYLLKYAQQLRNMQKKYEYDNWISSSPTTHIMCMLAGIKPIIVVMELNPWLYNTTFQAGLSRIKQTVVKCGKGVAIQLEKLAYRNATNIVVFSKYIQSEVFKTYGMDSTVIYSGVDSEHFHRWAKPEIYEKYKGKKVVLHVASSLTPMKGTDLAVEAMGLVNKEFPEALLLIVNSNKDSDRQYELNMKAKECKAQIEFVTGVSEEDLPSYYSIAQCLLSPSLDYNIHLPVIEAACCETPAVCLQGNNIPEDVDDGHSGIVTRHLAWAVSSYLKNGKDRRMAGSYARFYIKNKFNWEVCVERYRKIINRRISVCNDESKGGVLCTK